MVAVSLPSQLRGFKMGLSQALPSQQLPLMSVLGVSDGSDSPLL